LILLLLLLLLFFFFFFIIHFIFYTKVEYTDNHLNIIIISTTGDGEPPDNAIHFYNGLLSGNEFITSSLTNKRYGLLGKNKNKKIRKRNN